MTLILEIAAGVIIGLSVYHLLDVVPGKWVLNAVIYLACFVALVSGVIGFYFLGAWFWHRPEMFAGFIMFGGLGGLFLHEFVKGYRGERNPTTISPSR